MLRILRSCQPFSKLPKWATVDPDSLSGSNPHVVTCVLDGKVTRFSQQCSIPDPLTGEPFLRVSMPQGQELDAYVASQKAIPDWGLHNPFKNVERYNMYGDIFFAIAAELRKPAVEAFFTRLLQRVMPKSWKQALGQVVVTRKFFENFTGDNPRFFQRSFNVSGDHDGQMSGGFRWPYGNVACITPFNFPIEIPALQVYGALLTGNRPLLKCDNMVSVVVEQLLLMSQACGMPLKDVNFLNCSNQSMEYLIEHSQFRMVQFTGSSVVAEKLANKTNGRIKIEDAGIDWKILGPDVSNVDYVFWVCDQDAYAASGQKCSAQSILFIHENWMKENIIQKLATLSKRRKLQDLTVGPILTWDNPRIKAHIDSVLSLPGAKLSFGGNPLRNHTIPQCYGAYEPTAIQVPLTQFMKRIDLCGQELFGPFQLLVPYKDSEVDLVIECCNMFKHRLTAGVVSNDVLFIDKVVGQTNNGVTYTGIRGRTTGAPQNHWFGPCGDPRGAGIGTKEAILSVWTTHREVIKDCGPIPKNWKLPPPT